MRYLIALLLLAACASQEVLDPTGLDAQATSRIVKGCVNTDGTQCSNEGKSNVRVWEKK